MPFKTIKVCQFCGIDYENNGKFGRHSVPCPWQGRSEEYLFSEKYEVPSIYPSSDDGYQNTRGKLS